MAIRKNTLLSILALSLLYSASAHAEEAARPGARQADTAFRTTGTVQAAAPDVQAVRDAQAAQPSQPSPAPTSIYLDGSPLQTETDPVNVNGTLLVPMRRLFEVQGAKLAWNNADKTVTATKGATTLVYRIGDLTAMVNDRTVQLDAPGQVSEGYTMVPLRFISEALGSTVTWDQAARAVQIFTFTFETSIRWGVNLRSSPDPGSGLPDAEGPSLTLTKTGRSPVAGGGSTDAGGNSAILKLLPAKSKVHVVREVDAFWLEVRTPDNLTGYISAKPKYSDYTSPSLTGLQTDELIAYGDTFLGTPYEFGASPDQTGSFDCSSFVKRVFQDTLAIDLPRVSYDQAKAGKEVGLDELRRGDLLFFGTRDLNIGHVAIYAGDNKLLHTYSEKYGVRNEAFSDYWKKRFVTARRVF
ncbi:hypothetical protein J2Z22_003831 [Paenibacillus forsythiae]|uniref:NlpC/P60 domain-containing protein n=1 Tax=Paenibacillus forsythiae TaxID=365616 RepID=A0ABU3HBP8_9BACL|nr:stalk domain-containing protein [Paenibacillus forsythiae]MDT3428239.1 hypothetical protein [Paenibacillus forsythiae]